MECKNVREKLLEYADGGLSLREAVAVRTHLSHCYTCNEESEEIRAVLDTCRAALKHPRPINRFAQLRERIASEDKPEVVHLRRPHMRRFGYALATAAALVMVFWCSAPTVRAARAFLAPLRPDSASFQEWAQSKESVAPIVAKDFVDRRMNIENELDKEGPALEPTRLAQHPAEADSPIAEPVTRPSEKPADDQDARLTPGASSRVPFAA